MKKLSMAARLGVYALGIWLVSFGIVLCKKCGFGISPISCIPFVLEKVLPLSFGILTMLFHLVNIFVQMILTPPRSGIGGGGSPLWRRAIPGLTDKKLILQVPVAFLFGWVIDFMQKQVVIDEKSMGIRIAALIFSVFFTALGMVCMVGMNLVQNPPDGCVKLISLRKNKEFGRVKIGYDLVCVALAAVLGLIFLQRLSGIGVATIVSAVFVGKTVTWIRCGMHRFAGACVPVFSGVVRGAIRFARRWE